MASRRSIFRRRYNPYVAVVGLLVMLVGAVIVLAIFFLGADIEQNFDNVVLGAALTVIGWLLQMIFGKRSSRRGG